MKKVLFFIAGSLVIGNATAQIGPAITSFSSGKLDQAKTQIDNAVSNDKQNTKSKTWFYRGEVYRGIASDPTGVYAKLDTNALQVAYESYRKAQELEPGSTFAKQAAEKQTELSGVAINKGAEKFSANDYPAAARAFELARQLNPKDTVAALYSAYAYINMQQKELYPKAIDALQVMIDNKTTNPANYATMIDLLQATENTDRAISVANKAVEAFPDNKDLRDKQFNLYVATNRTDEAKANLLEAVKREPNNAVYLKNLGILYDQSGEKAKAIEFYEEPWPLIRPATMPTSTLVYCITTKALIFPRKSATWTSSSTRKTESVWKEKPKNISRKHCLTLKETTRPTPKMATCWSR